MTAKKATGLPSFTELVVSGMAKVTLSQAELNAYDHVIVGFSGGKDSIACFLQLLELGVDKSKIELWHHDVDGREHAPNEDGSYAGLMDWACTADYCRKFAAAFDVPIYFSWKMGGFEREMLRNGDRTAPVKFENPDGSITQTGGELGKEGVRRKFPQVSADLSVRWCSAYLKIDPCSKVINNSERFLGKKTILITGERAEESSARAKYKMLEPHKCDNRAGQYSVVLGERQPGMLKHVDQYRLGWGRVSCMNCIFGSKDQFASVKAIAPKRFEKMAAYEDEFGVTVKRKVTLRELAEKGTPYKMSQRDVEASVSPVFEEAVLVPEDEAWKLPAGAFGESCGPL